MRYYARLNPAKLDPAFLQRDEVLRLSDVGAQLGFGLSVLHERSLLHDGSSLDPSRPLPLLTWPLLDFIDSLELSQQSLLELGAGNSTLWFQRRFGKVRSLETDPGWYTPLSKMIAPNVELELLPLEALESAAFEYRGESYLLVDFAGRRTRFLKHFLASCGPVRPRAIVLDNADWYRNGARLLAGAGYREIPFYGFKSGQPFISCTSVFVDLERFEPSLKQPFFRPAFSRDVANVWDEP